jgi:E3 ubiquitin-protein ligase TRIP12
LWRSKTPDGSLYPKPMSPKVEQKPIIEKFHLMGVFVAKSLCDNRLIDLPINSLMWDLLMGKKKNLFDLKKLDETLFNLISEL